MRRVSKPVSGVTLTGFLFAWLLAGCAINPELDVAEISQRPNVQLQVPFYAQEKYQCGPAALAGVLQASHVPVTVDSLVEMVYLPERQGSLQLELLTATRRHGRIAYVLEPVPHAVIAEVSAGRPVLILQNLGTRSIPIWHYAVVTGFDAERNRVVLNSGVTESLEMKADSWLRTWDWADRWAMMALRPGELPASDRFRPYAEAVSAYERLADDESVQIAWNMALERWPKEAAPYLALGNLAYGNGDRVQAQALFEKGLTLEPNDPRAVQQPG